MSEIQRINVQQHKKNIFDKYKTTTQQELLTVIGGNANELEGIAVPKNQEQSEGSVGFDTGEIKSATQDLQQQGHQTDEIGFFHNHNRDSNHGFDFSEADLDTAQHLYEEHGVDRMGLIMNGESDENINVQHMVVANHEGELHELEGENGTGKVITMVTEKSGEQHEIYSETIEEAEEKEKQIMQLKDLLNEESELAQAA